MIIGLISDSHDNLPKIKKAVDLFKKKHVELILHAGDYVAPFSFIPIKKSGIDFIGVFGNNDGEKEGLTNISDGRIEEGPLVLEKFGKKIALVHDLDKLNKDSDYDLIFYGHTHKQKIESKDESLYVNPGECGGWLTGISTVSIVDLVSLKAKIMRL